MKKLFGFWFLLSFSLLLGAQTPLSNLPDFTGIVEKQGASVVNISTTQIIRGGRGNFGGLPLDENDPMFEFFRRFIPRQPGAPNGGNGGREYENHSLGSGFIVSADGYILTNAHVIDAADEILVRLTDKREFKARLIGADKRTDVALIKIEAKNLPAVTLGSPSDLKVGEWVVAIGSPFGFDNSVTAGIVSAKGRSLPQENFVPFIQTDVAVNPGNSGGPLFNLKGEVVGINSQIYSRSGGFMGISFAIPIDVAMEVQKQLRATGKVSRGRIGVVIQEVSKELAESLGLAKTEGAIVSQVEKGGPADKAGLVAGDVILRFDGKTIEKSADLSRFVGGTSPGASVKLHIWRSGKERELSLTVGQMAEEKVAKDTRSGGRAPAEALSNNRLGLALSDLSAEQKQSLKLSSGIVIEGVRNNTRADLQRGDIILAIIAKGVTQEVKNVEHFNREIASLAQNAPFSLLIKRGEAQIFVTIKAGEK